jgi:dTDP-4-amino-4,6-dideoxygalactose transaminase
MIPFNKPHLTGKEAHYLYQAVQSGKLSGNGMYTKKTQEEFCRRYAFRKTLLTTSCTDALEMCALLAGIEPGDEVIMPAYTFVSTANAFMLRAFSIAFWIATGTSRALP